MIDGSRIREGFKTLEAAEERATQIRNQHREVGKAAFDLRGTPTLDLMADLERKLGHRLSLDSLALPTLNAPKVADGMAALQWWKQGKLMEIAEYCCYDVKITKLLDEYGQQHGEAFCNDRYR